MTLNPKGLTKLLDILDEENLDTSLESLCNQLHQSFPKEDRFKVGMTLVLLLQHIDLLPKNVQRIIAVALLYDLYRGEPLASTPFAPVFVQVLKSQEDTNNGVPKTNFSGHIPVLSQCERNLLINLLGYNQKDVLKKTARQIVDELYFASVPSIDLSNLQAQLTERHSELPAIAKCGNPVILPDMDHSKVTEIDKNATKSMTDVLIANDRPLYSQSYRPEFLRLEIGRAHV